MKNEDFKKLIMLLGRKNFNCSFDFEYDIEKNNLRLIPYDLLKEKDFNDIINFIEKNYFVLSKKFEDKSINDEYLKEDYTHDYIVYEDIVLLDKKNKTNDILKLIENEV